MKLVPSYQRRRSYKSTLGRSPASMTTMQMIERLDYSKPPLRRRALRAFHRDEQGTADVLPEGATMSYRDNNHPRIYIAFHKRNPTVLRRLPTDRAAPDFWFLSPKAALDYQAGFSVMDPSDYLVVGGDVAGEPDEHDTYTVALDWSDLHEAYLIVHPEKRGVTT